MESEYFEKLLDQRFENIHNKLDNILIQTTKTNGTVKDHEEEIKQIKLDLAVSQGHWKGVNKTINILLTIAGIVVGAIITWQFH